MRRFNENTRRFGNKREQKKCKLYKSLYGLKQASREWNQKLTLALLSFCFFKVAYYSFFILSKGGNIIVVLVYADDLLIDEDCMEEIKSVKSNLQGQFSMKDLGELKYFLGIEVVWSS